ncbi:DUF4148 domain-containing protein [Burkholderia gladioli]|uniref:DUF4148 domain-containing protein n=1 Tax=Burkholderia gladioli TaxID=28095 RepID=UPI00163E7E4A|nr:DUF4148 domain-containing protein [Burkholderia gladioli]
MKNLIQAVAIAAALVVPAAAFAQTQSNGAVTRAQVRAELVQLEQTGWRPAAGSDPRYPDDILAAEKKVAALNGADTSGYGGVSNKVQAGSPIGRGVSKSDWNAMYSHP